MPKGKYSVEDVAQVGGGGAAKGQYTLADVSGVEPADHNTPNGVSGEWEEDSPAEGILGRIKSLASLPSQVADIWHSTDSDQGIVRHGSDFGQKLIDRLIDEPSQDNAIKMQQALDRHDLPGAVIHAGAAINPFAASAGSIYDRSRPDNPDAVPNKAAAEGVFDAITLGRGLPEDSLLGEASRVATSPITKPVSLAARAAGRKSISLLDRVTAPYAKQMTSKLPGERFTPAERMAAADDAGMEMSAAEILNDPTLRNIQGVGERSMFGRRPIQHHVAQGRKSLTEWLDRYTDQITGGKGVLNPEQVGQSLRTGIAGSRDALKRSAQADFDAWLKATGDPEVDISSIAGKYKAQRAEMEQVLNSLPEEAARPLRSIYDKASRMGVDPEKASMLDELSQYPEHVQQSFKQANPDLMSQGKLKLSQLQKIREAYMDMAMNYGGNIPENFNRIAGEVAGDIQGHMLTTSRSMGAESAYLRANSKWSQLQDLYNTPGKGFYSALKAGKDIHVPDTFLEVGAAGGDPAAIRALKEAGVDTSPLQAELLNRLRKQSLRYYGDSRLGGYQDPFLSELLGPDKLAELHKMAQNARAINFDINPTNTAGTLSATEDLGRIARLAFRNPVSKYIAAKASVSPTVKSWLTRTEGAGTKLVNRLGGGGGSATPKMSPPPTPPAPPSTRKAAPRLKQFNQAVPLPGVPGQSTLDEVLASKAKEMQPEVLQRSQTLMQRLKNTKRADEILDQAPAKSKRTLFPKPRSISESSKFSNAPKPKLLERGQAQDPHQLDFSQVERKPESVTDKRQVRPEEGEIRQPGEDFEPKRTLKERMAKARLAKERQSVIRNKEFNEGNNPARPPRARKGFHSTLFRNMKGVLRMGIEPAELEARAAFHSGVKENQPVVFFGNRKSVAKHNLTLKRDEESFFGPKSNKSPGVIFEVKVGKGSPVFDDLDWTGEPNSGAYFTTDPISQEDIKRVIILDAKGNEIRSLSPEEADRISAVVQKKKGGGYVRLKDRISGASGAKDKASDARPASEQAAPEHHPSPKKSRLKDRLKKEK